MPSWRYLRVVSPIDSVGKSAVKPDSIRLQDYSPVNVEAGNRMIAARGLAATASFHEADAFDGDKLAATTPRPDLAIVSGLYELFPDNGQIAASLAGLAKAMKPGALLLYTGQPWHPQLEMIARALTSHRGGAAWVMRRPWATRPPRVPSLPGVVVTSRIAAIGWLEPGCEQ